MAHTLLVTGGAGFIGSNFVRTMLRSGDYRVINLDALTYAGNPANLHDCETNPHYRFVHGNILDGTLVRHVLREEKVRGILNFAAESHVDRSINGAGVFVDTNVKGTLVLMEAALECGVERFLQVSTDEVYGSLGPEGRFSEQSALQPNSPYAASKTAADVLVRAFAHTHGLPTLITRCSNNYGPFQFPEKLIPLMILNALDGKSLPVYGDGKNVRDWIHVEDHCNAIKAVYERGTSGEVYNIGGDSERENIQVVRTILRILDKPETLIAYVKDRPGHDRRYAIDATKITTSLGWKPQYNFEQALAETVRWYREHPEWCNAVRSGAYRDYYAKQYESESDNNG